MKFFEKEMETLKNKYKSSLRKMLLQQEIAEIATRNRKVTKSQRTILYIQKYQIIEHYLNNQIWILMCSFMYNGSLIQKACL